MPLVSRRRWWSFSLRTMFLAVTAATILAWATMWSLNERRTLRNWVERDGGALMYYEPKEEVLWHWAAGKLSWFERALGERPVHFVGMPHDATDADEQRIRRAFPEVTALGRCAPREKKQ